MRQSNSLNQIFIKTQIPGDGAADLRYLQAVCQARAEKISLKNNKNLGLVFKSAECGGMNNAITIALEFRTAGGRLFLDTAAARIYRADRIRRQLIHGRYIPEAFQ